MIGNSHVPFLGEGGTVMYPLLPDLDLTQYLLPPIAGFSIPQLAYYGHLC